MTKGVSFRPNLLPPRSRQLQRSYRPFITCFTVSSCIALLICVVFGLTAFNIYKHRFGLTEHHFHSGDQVSLLQVGLDLTSTFCTAYDVRPQGIADFYLLPHVAELDPTARVNLTFTMKLKAQPGHFPPETSIHYLTKDSVVLLTACRNSPPESDLSRSRYYIPAEILVIVGDDNYEEWLKHSHRSHIKHRASVPKNAVCNTTSHPQLVFTVSYPVNYFFVLLVNYHYPFMQQDAGSITLTGFINKTQYNISGALSTCHANETLCRFFLDWGGHYDVVAQVLEKFRDASFFSACSERLAFWIPVFGVAPVFIVSLMSVWCWCLLVKKRSLRSHYHHPETSHENHTSYGAMNEEITPLIADPPEHAEDEHCASIQDK